MKIFFAMTLAVLSFTAHAWMDPWAPELNSTPMRVKEVSKKSVSNYVHTVEGTSGISTYYSEGGSADLNGDGIDDYVFIIPWMGCGLNADGCYIHFLVSDGKGGRMRTVTEGYGSEMSDIVNVEGKAYFRVSGFFNAFEKSRHNHWVYQMFTFGTNGVMRCANSDFGNKFPAVTIFYSNPKFRQIELTENDLKTISNETRCESEKFVP